MPSHPSESSSAYFMGGPLDGQSANIELATQTVRAPIFDGSIAYIDSETGLPARAFPEAVYRCTEQCSSGDRAVYRYEFAEVKPAKVPD